MGWNKVEFRKAVPFTCADNHFYFVNSYFAIPREKADVWGVADYGGEFTAAAHKDNIYGTQFHIEKSGEAGLKLLRGFLQC
jgi:glutamine amidotransferase